MIVSQGCLIGNYATVQDMLHVFLPVPHSHICQNDPVSFHVANLLALSSVRFLTKPVHTALARLMVSMHLLVLSTAGGLTRNGGIHCKTTVTFIPTRTTFQSQ